MGPEIQKLNRTDSSVALWSSMHKAVHTWTGMHIFPLFLFLYSETPEMQSALSDMDRGLGVAEGYTMAAINVACGKFVDAMGSLPAEASTQERVSHFKKLFEKGGASVEGSVRSAQKAPNANTSRFRTKAQSAE